jgi:alkylation response protein AidB-like acyl-CoA dehydrogenase
MEQLQDRAGGTLMSIRVTRDSTDDQIRAETFEWVERHVPQTWRDASVGGRTAIRAVRSYRDYETWYPTFAASGMAVPTWPAPYGGLDLTPAQARVMEGILAPYNLGRLNIIALGAISPALFAFGTEEQRLRFLPPMVRNEEVWSQLLSEPGAGSDLSSLATRAVRDGDEWIVTGQKVWSTWAHRAQFANCLARTDPTATKREGLTYFLIDLRAPGVTVKPLRHMAGEVEFSEVFLDEARIPDSRRVGEPGNGWRVVNATLSGERMMVSGSGSGGVERIGGEGVAALIDEARRRGKLSDPVLRQRIAALHSEERIRNWTNERVRHAASVGRPLGPVASVGKIHQGDLNQRVQLLASDILGSDAAAWEASASFGDPDSWCDSLPRAVKGMLRSRANTIEGGTSEVNRNVLADHVLGLPREPDPFLGKPWSEIPRS